MQQLLSGTTLQNGKYRIERVLGQGGFGITYLAENTMLEGKVAIKEFFLKDYCDRNESAGNVTITSTANRELVERFKQKFIKEARNIFKLNHPNIVRILDIFEENGTAYYVMEYAEGGSLADRVKREGYLSEPVATRYILQVAEALDYIHQRKMNHLDIKSANIMLNEKDECVLIDFGLSKQYDAVTGSQTSTTPVGISEGYAPMEQYMQGGVSEFSPETDIYALGATYFALLTGMCPPNAFSIFNNGFPKEALAKKTSNKDIIVAIVKAMQPSRVNRCASILEFKSLLSDQTSVKGKDETHILKSFEQSNPSFKLKPLIFNVKGVEFKMIPIEGGTFRMGSSDPEASDDEMPIHNVTLSDYYIGETPVTQALWKTVMDNWNPSLWEGDDHPVGYIAWNYLNDFFRKLNNITGKTFRLPTEAEWEFAAKGGNYSQGYKYSGSDSIDDVAWYGGNSGMKTHPVATKLANELGIYDMSGNVEEWCSDWFGNYSSHAQTNPIGPDCGTVRVMRGAGFRWDAVSNRVSCRSFGNLNSCSPEGGFRLVLVP